MKGNSLDAQVDHEANSYEVVVGCRMSRPKTPLEYFSVANGMEIWVLSVRTVVTPSRAVYVNL